jgi:hypothetical protein
MQRYEADIRTHISVNILAFLHNHCLIDRAIVEDLHWQFEIQIWMWGEGNEN